MAKTNTLQTQVAAQAKLVDRDAIMDALVKATAKAAPRSVPRPSPTPPPSQQERGIPKRRRASFSRVGFRRYEVTRPTAALGHKRGTWTRFMVETVLAYEDTRTATDAHRKSEAYPDKTLDFNWMVKQGYIAYK